MKCEIEKADSGILNLPKAEMEVWVICKSYNALLADLL